MRVGTMTALFRDRIEQSGHIGYIESMRRCKHAGFSVIDMNMCAMSHNMTELNGDDWERKTEKICEEAQRLDVVFSQSHPPYHGNKLAEFASYEEKEYFEEMMIRSIKISAMLGVKWAVLHPISDFEEAEYRIEQDVRKNHQVYDKVVEYAIKNHVGIAFENMADKNGRRRFGTTSSELKALVESYNDPMVGICWDTGHGNRSHDNPVRPLYELGGLIKALHINDNQGFLDDHLLPYEGTLDWKEIMRALNAINYTGDFIYEIKNNNRMPDAMKDVTAEYAYRLGTYLISLEV